MALDIVVTSDRLRRDPASRDFIDHLTQKQVALQLDKAVLYYDFPVYADYETEFHRPDVLLFSPCHGIVAVRFIDDSIFAKSRGSVAQQAASLDDFCSNLYSRLLRSRDLRSGRNSLLFEVRPIIFDVQAQGAATIESGGGSEVPICGSFAAFDELLSDYSTSPLGDLVAAEVRSVVEGAKALTRPIKRTVADPVAQPLAAAMAALEADIANFDQKQRKVAIVEVGGPARIRGLAGSGKTVILAMKAAHLHLTNPDHQILVTFYTKSLRNTLKDLITKFYRHYSESDPDWGRIHIRHGWGGARTPGVYADACRRVGRPPLNFGDAQRSPRGRADPFAYVCESLIESTTIEGFYDHVLIDEGQDFPSSFYVLCFHLAKGVRDRKSIVWAYDELQNILDVQIRSPTELFGRDVDGEPRISLDRSAPNVPPGATNDAVLSKCYRNQLEVLVTAHAMGFGVYGQIVQLLESAEHWQDVGYEMLSGPLVAGQPVRLVRLRENSPIAISGGDRFPLIDKSLHVDMQSEVRDVADSVSRFLSAGLNPEEILIISLDDRHARSYFTALSEALAALDIKTNNILADPYNEPPFSMPGMVTLSTVYRAKGNEAAAVFAVGVDAVNTRSRAGRNKLFTAFTRTKAWLRVSGVRGALGTAERVLAELDQAVALAPEMRFTMPDLRAVETIQRDLSKREAKLQAARAKYVKELKALGLSAEEIEEEISSNTKLE